MSFWRTGPASPMTGWSSLPASTSLTPSQIAGVYGINLSPNTGNGVTIAIVGAYNDPNIQSDLAAFSTKYGLPLGSLTVVNQNGGSTPPVQLEPAVTGK